MFVFNFPELIYGAPVVKVKQQAFSIAGLTKLIFINIFCFQMWKVNEQFGSFFRLIKDQSYPYKTAKIIFIIYYVLGVSTELIRFVLIPLGAHINWAYLCALVIMMYEQFFLVMQTLGLLYLADCQFN